MEEINKTINAEQEAKSLVPSGYAELVPDEEKEVAPLNPDELHLTVECDNVDMESMIPEDEVALGEAREATFIEADRRGVFSVNKGMGQIRGVFDDSIFASVSLDDEGMNCIRFCQRFSNGAFSPIIEVPQAQLFLLASADFQLEHFSSLVQKKRSEQFILDVQMKYLNGLSIQCKDYYAIMDILKVLYVLRCSLPQQAVERRNPGLELYEQIVEVIEDSKLSGYFITKQSYWAFYSDGMKALAKTLGLPQLQLLRKLKEYGLLYLTGDPKKPRKGYQTKVRVGKGDKDGIDMYCILNLSFFDKITGNAPEEPDQEW